MLQAKFTFIRGGGGKRIGWQAASCRRGISKD